jgi:hypothetical protein
MVRFVYTVCDGDTFSINLSNQAGKPVYELSLTYERARDGKPFERHYEHKELMDYQILAFNPKIVERICARPPDTVDNSADDGVDVQYFVPVDTERVSITFALKYKVPEGLTARDAANDNLLRSLARRLEKLEAEVKTKNSMIITCLLAGNQNDLRMMTAMRDDGIKLQDDPKLIVQASCNCNWWGPDLNPGKHTVIKQVEAAIIAAITQTDSIAKLSWQEAARLPQQLGLAAQYGATHHKGCGGDLIRVVCGEGCWFMLGYNPHIACTLTCQPNYTPSIYYDWTTLTAEFRPRYCGPPPAPISETKCESIAYSIGHVIVALAAIRRPSIIREAVKAEIPLWQKASNGMTPCDMLSTFVHNASGMQSTAHPRFEEVCKNLAIARDELMMLKPIERPKQVKQVKPPKYESDSETDSDDGPLTCCLNGED